MTDSFKFKKNKEDIDPISDVCVLMVQSPYSLYCYWEISSMKKEIVECHLHDDWYTFETRLRIYDITDLSFNGDNAHCFQDIYMEKSSKHCFIKDLLSTHTYCVDVGVVTRENSFFPLVRSNPVDTPRAFCLEDGLTKTVLTNWNKGNSGNPEWIDGYSSYSYYGKCK